MQILCAEFNKIKKIPSLIWISPKLFLFSLCLPICLFPFYFCKRGNIKMGTIVSRVTITNFCGLFFVFPRESWEGFWALHLPSLGDANIAWVSSLAPYHIHWWGPRGISRKKKSICNKPVPSYFVSVIWENWGKAIVGR